MDEENTDIISISLNPGTVKTDGATSAMPFMVRPFVWLFFTAPDKGALTILFAAAAKTVRENAELWKGRYLDGLAYIKTPSPRSQDLAAARNLWTTTEAAVRALGAFDEI